MTFICIYYNYFISDLLLQNLENQFQVVMLVLAIQVLIEAVEVKVNKIDFEIFVFITLR